jgi:hypothetical protein
MRRMRIFLQKFHKKLHFRLNLKFDVFDGFNLGMQSTLNAKKFKKLAEECWSAKLS